MTKRRANRGSSQSLGEEKFEDEMKPSLVTPTALPFLLIANAKLKPHPRCPSTSNTGVVGTIVDGVPVPIAMLV